MRLSIVIVTYRRATICLETIRLLAPLLSPDDELIIVEQVDADIRRLHANEASAQVRFLCLGQPSMVAARNAGIAAAQGKVVLFVDDDVVPSATLLDAHAKAYFDPIVGGVAGRIFGPHETEADAADAVSTNWMDTNFNMSCRTFVDTARGCNMSFRRELLIDIGGFDTNFCPPFFFREDSDLSFRVREAGYKVLFEPAACLRHLEAKSGGARSAEKPRSLLSAELWMYEQHFHHYRDNLYFLLKHFRGAQLRHHIRRSWHDYVGRSRWPWRLVAKNACFAAALVSAYTAHPRPSSDPSQKARLSLKTQAGRSE